MLKKATEAKVHDIDDAKGIVAVYASAFGNVDSDGDITAHGAFTKTLSENKNRIKWFLNHDPKLNIGVPLLKGTKEDSFGLLSVGQLNLKKQLGRDVFEDYKLHAEHGRTLEHSIGFEIAKSHPETVKSKGEERDVRVITEYKLWEMSTLTAWGANESTPMVDMKSLDDTLELLETQLKYNYSDERLEKVESMLKSLRKPDATSIEPIELIKSYYESINK
jgi:HK97 family phage prohead protease